MAHVDSMNFTLQPPSITNVATLPCESQNTENVILQPEITKTIAWNAPQLHQSGPGSSCALNLLIWVLYSNACMKRFKTSSSCQNAWCKLGLTLTRTLLILRLTSCVTVWDHVCMLVADTLNTCSDMKVHLGPVWFIRTFLGDRL